MPAPDHLSPEAKKRFLAGQEIYFREGHCATCHQANGGGLDPAFPSIQKSPWVNDDSDRLIKLAKAIRAANPGRTNFYTVEELLKQHPFKK